MRPVLITGARSAAALDIARDFARAGHAVHMADCSTARIARWSRTVAKVHRHPAPRRDPAAFRAVMLALVDALDPVLIVPTCEEVFHLATLPIGPRLFQPPAATLARLHDKGGFAELCRSIGLPAPETHAIDGPRGLAPFRRRSRDWVFKPRFSRFGEQTLVGPSEGALARIDISTGGGWIAQRRVEGREVSFYAVAREGGVVAFSAYGSAWRLRGGACLTFDPLERRLASAALDLAVRLAAGTGLTGQFACDLIFDRHDRPWLIECNPRATSGVHLLVGDGRLAAAMVAGKETVFAGDGSRHLLPAFATYGLGLALRTGRLAEWGGQLRRGRDVAGRAGDRWPMLGAMADGLGFMLSAAIRGVSTVAATTMDIEWNGESLP